MRLSCPTTFFWKVIFVGGIAAYAIGVIGYGLIALLRGTLDEPASKAFWAVIFFGAIGTFAFWMLGRLKALRIEGSQLVVSNYLKRIRTPLTNVAEITGPENSSHQRVHVRFKAPTEFGEKIVFMPPIFAAKSTANAFRNAVENAEKAEASSTKS